MEAIKSPYGRCAWLNLFEQDENGKYGMALYLPRRAEALETLRPRGLTDTHVDMLLKTTEDFKSTVLSKAKTEAPKGFKVETLFKDGDEKSDIAVDNFKEANPGKEVPRYCYWSQHFWIINLKTKYQPRFYGPRASEGELSIEQAKLMIHGGAWVRCDVRGYAWNFNGKKGYSLGLGGTVQLWQDDENWDAGSGEVEAEDTLTLGAPEAKAEDFLN